MSSKSRTLETTAIERQISERARAAKLKLRFDKVVRRLTGDLKTALDGVVPAGQSVVITISAPIKHPAKTAASLERIVRAGLNREGFHDTLHGNQVRVRRISRLAKHVPKVLAFVHNTESDANLIIDIAEARLRVSD